MSCGHTARLSNGSQLLGCRSAHAAAEAWQPRSCFIVCGSPAPPAVAHIRLPSTGRWWRYDDETVTELGAAPLAPQDHGTTAQADKTGGAGAGAKGGKGKAKGKGGGGRKRRRKAKSDEEESDSEGGLEDAVKDDPNDSDADFDIDEVGILGCNDFFWWMHAIVFACLFVGACSACGEPPADCCSWPRLSQRC